MNSDWWSSFCHLSYAPKLCIKHTRKSRMFYFKLRPWAGSYIYIIKNLSILLYPQVNGKVKPRHFGSNYSTLVRWLTDRIILWLAMSTWGWYARMCVMIWDSVPTVTTIEVVVPRYRSRCPRVTKPNGEVTRGRPKHGRRN